MKFSCAHILRLSILSLVLVSNGILRADFAITGFIPDLTPGSKILLQRVDLDTRIETTEGELIVGNNHRFENNFKLEPGLFNLVIPRLGTIPLAIDDGQNISINSAAGIQITGSPDTDILNAYEAFRKDSLARLVYPPRARLNQAKDTGMSAEQMAPLAQAEVDGYNAHKRELNDFTIEQAGSSVALYATSLRWDGDYLLDELQSLVDDFATTHPDLAITRSMQERLRLFSVTAIGAEAAPLAGKDLDGQTYSLDDFSGKTVLVDFWASWCVPCRVENRHYPKLLEKYADQGFVVLAVNMDDSRSAWGRASQQDNITWPQISDGLALKSPMATAYNVTALPMSFLIGPDGKILGRNLRGDALDEKLETVFKKE